MKLTEKLLRFFNRPFNKDPIRFVAFRLSYVGGAMTYKVEDNRLTTSVVDLPDADLSIDLNQYTLASLAAFLATRPGYSVSTVDETSRSSLGATALLDGSGKSGDPLFGYESLLFAYLNSVAVELKAAKAQISEAIRQLSLEKADADFANLHGDYYGVPRLTGEGDEEYAQRVIAEVFQSRANNVIMATAIDRAAGSEGVRVVDVETSENGSLVFYNGSIVHDGLNTSGARAFGLFDVNANFQLDGPQDINLFRARVGFVAQRFRAAGTHLRNTNIAGVFNPDLVPAQTEAFSTAGVLSELSDRYRRVENADAYYDDSLTHNGAALHSTDADDVFSPDDDALAVTMSFDFSDAVQAGEYLHNEAITYNGQAFHERLLNPATDRVSISVETALSDTVETASDELDSVAEYAFEDTFEKLTGSHDAILLYDGSASYGGTGIQATTTDEFVAMGSLAELQDTQVVQYHDHSNQILADGSFSYGVIDRPATDSLALLITQQTVSGPVTTLVYA